jgi:hypothetical protein
MLSTISTHASESVIYQRGNYTVVIKVTAVDAAPETASPDPRTSLESQTQDWAFRANSLVINGSPTLPQRGDKIQIQRGVTTLVYDVLPVGDRAYKFDPTGQMLTVSTRLT